MTSAMSLSERMARQCETVLRVAVQQIAERGYDSVRLRDVATNAGVSIGLLQHYFGSREDLRGRLFAADGPADTLSHSRSAHSLSSCECARWPPSCCLSRSLQGAAEAITGLAIDPRDSRHIVALGEQRGYVSRDGGSRCLRSQSPAGWSPGHPS